MTKKWLGLDLFSGAGGLSLGLHMAGWHMEAGFEIDGDAINTYTANFPATKIFACDARTIDFKPYQGIDLVAGGPPCQPFSVAGKQQAASDERDMVPHFIRAVKEIRPKAFLMENVAGLMTVRHKDYLSLITQKFRDLGYHLTVQILCAYDYGVPQRRKRVFFVGTQEGGFNFPLATHGPNGHHPFVTVREALKGVPEDVPNMAKVTYASKPIMRPSPFSGMLVNGQGRPIDLDGPCHTIPATAGGNRTHIVDIHGILKDYHKELLSNGAIRHGQVKNVRRLTAAESARLQSFPDDFTFIGKGSSRYRLIGNAVPPKLAQAVGKALIDFLEKAHGNTDKKKRGGKKLPSNTMFNRSEEDRPA